MSGIDLRKREYVSSASRKVICSN